MWRAIALLAVTCGTIHAQDAKPKPTRDRWNVAIVVHEKVELLDFAGPAEVFSTAGGGRAFKVYTVAESEKPVTSQGFLKITPQFTFAICPKPDVVVIPGGETVQLLRSAAAMKWVKSSAKDAEVMMSVCTGAFVLADVGLLDGKEATTHSSSISGLKKYKDIKVVTDRRVVDNGSTLTTAGVSAGTDGALHLTARLCGLETAKRTARYMEYNWTPEAAPANPSDLSPETKTQHAWFAGDWKSAGEGYATITAKNPTDGVAHANLGFCQAIQKKWPEAAASTVKAIECGHTTGRVQSQLGWIRMKQQQPAEAVKCYEKALADGEREWFVWLDLSRAYALTGQSNKALTTLERAYSEGCVSETAGPLVDQSFESIRGDARFGALIKKYTIDSTVRMARDDEPGDKLVVSGVVSGPDGPIANALVYVYHTDPSGHYTPNKRDRDPTPRYFAYLRTDRHGHYEYQTIRPGAYPGNTLPRHVHYEVWAEGLENWHGELFFSDDPLLPKGQVAAKVTKDSDGVRRCTFDLKLKKS